MRAFAVLSEPVHRLTYISRARLPADVDPAEAIRDIVNDATTRNRAAGLTSALVWLEGWFVQTLEGDKDKVEETFARISEDPRHHFLTVVENGPSEAREFAGWELFGRAHNLPVDDIIKTVGRSSAVLPDRITGAVALNLLQSVHGAQSQFI